MTLLYNISDFEVEFIAYPAWEDDGIGSYEFWGSKGYDSRPYLSCEKHDIIWNNELYTPLQNRIISEWLEENFAEVEKEFCNEYLKTQMP